MSDHSRRNRRLRISLLIALIVMVSVSVATTQNPVFTFNIDQTKLLNGGYDPACVLEAGGQFWTTPFTRYNAATGQGDGYGEGVTNGPRAQQRKIFNPTGFPQYPFLRLNGLDSQSCYECHNSIGSDPGYGAGSPLIRKQPSSVAGSAGSNSNAFINPCYPKPQTFLIRQPPHVFGSGYVQALSDEITAQLYALRCQARNAALKQPGVTQTVNLVDTKHNLNFGVFKTTYVKGSKWSVKGSNNSCGGQPCNLPSAPVPTADSNPCSPVVDGFTDDVTAVKGVAYDLIVRPFQWKGIASSLRHFVRDALDFHFSMQAVEKVGSFDCDMDGKANEVQVGNVSAITAFVGMTRPPQQVIQPGTEATVARGFQIFTGTLTNPSSPLSGKMCATCHVPAMPLVSPNPQFVIANPDIPTVTSASQCPTEATQGYASLVGQEKAPAKLAVVKQAMAAAGLAPVPQSYNIPLNSMSVPGFALPRLTQTAPFFVSIPKPAGGFFIPLFSDLQSHDMGTGLMDIGPQGADVAGICIAPRIFMTRPLWGVADTGPWLHDGRATTLLEAIILHGGSSTGSEAGKIIDAFSKLNAADQQAVVTFLLTLRLPTEQNSPPLPACRF